MRMQTRLINFESGLNYVPETRRGIRRFESERSASYPVSQPDEFASVFSLRVTKKNRSDMTPRRSRRSALSAPWILRFPKFSFKSLRAPPPRSSVHYWLLQTVDSGVPSVSFPFETPPPRSISVTNPFCEIVPAVSGAKLPIAFDEVTE